ncbi:hypothetical protein GCM10018793_42350 [Streptomyces sulfonofaciens]|uniref:MmyB-like transcription regulator ligand binding domain-containing protein n=1 Tax=Streptomyces sulfonofaciens TaxID=68272 RepID=A0A919GDF8_9ACTN|nr:hypothetical protein [Streptomyces sulfonofaciens]GHH82461.1 hypothetical protein GCM10018793_42350 [Streptomyces sulfonofaciens]
MAHRAGGWRSGTGHDPGDPEVRAYLEDYTVLLSTVPHPSVVYDHRWDVVLANPAFDALFQGIAPHPTAMPHDNLMRFVLFHPQAGSVLGEHESSWCLPMLAHLAKGLEEHGQDAGLLAIRREIEDDPIMEAAYRQGLPHWLRTVGPDAAEHDGSVRPLWHPDPRWGRTHCRVVADTPRMLQALGYHHLTLVLREPRGGPRGMRAAPGGRRAAGHLRAVPAAEA